MPDSFPRIGAVTGGLEPPGPPRPNRPAAGRELPGVPVRIGRRESAPFRGNDYRTNTPSLPVVLARSQRWTSQPFPFSVWIWLARSKRQNSAHLFCKPNAAIRDSLGSPQKGKSSSFFDSSNLTRLTRIFRTNCSPAQVPAALFLRILKSRHLPVIAHGIAID
jgi:hypothetical protein